MPYLAMNTKPLLAAIALWVALALAVSLPLQAQQDPNAAPQQPIYQQAPAPPPVPNYGQPVTPTPVPNYGQQVAQPQAQPPGLAQPVTPTPVPNYGQPAVPAVPDYGQAPPPPPPAYGQPAAPAPYQQPAAQPAAPAPYQQPAAQPAAPAPYQQPVAQPAGQAPYQQPGAQPAGQAGAQPQGGGQEIQYPPQVLVADPDSPAVQQGQDPSLGATPAATQDIDMMLPVPKPPDDPEAREVYNAMETWHRALLSAYRVNLTKLPDPFMPIETVMRPPAQENTDPEARKRLPMIQRLALNSFTLTAIVVHPNPNNSTALVDSGGVGYLIRLGTKIGPNNGVVKEITDNKVVIEEPEVGYRGDTRSRLTELRLNPIDSGLPEDGILVDETA